MDMEKHVDVSKEKAEKVEKEIIETLCKGQEKDRALILDLDKKIEMINMESSKEKQAAMAMEIAMMLERSEEICSYVACRYSEYDMRGRKGEVGANAVLFAVQQFGEDRFWEKAALYRMRNETFERCFPGFEKDTKLRTAFSVLDSREAAVIREKEARMKKEFSDELDRAYKEQKEKDRKENVKIETKLLFQDIGFLLLGILFTGLFGTTALAHWALHNGWSGPQNVFLEVIFPFLMVVGTIIFAALAVGFLLLQIDSAFMWIGYGLGGAAAIAFLIFWKHRAVQIGAQILIAGLILIFLILIIVKFFKYLKRIRQLR